MIFSNGGLTATFNLQFAILELPCFCFRSCHTRLTDGRCLNFIQLANVRVITACKCANVEVWLTKTF